MSGICRKRCKKPLSFHSFFVVTPFFLSKPFFPDITMGILEQLYDAVRRRTNNFRIEIPHSAVFYARAAIEEGTGKRLSLADTEKVLYEEGFFPAKAYGIPKWYRDKYPVDDPQDVERFPSWYNNFQPAILDPAGPAVKANPAN